MKNKFSYLWTKDFWKYASARALWTFAETFLGATAGTSTFDKLNWKVVLFTTGLATLCSIFKSIVAGIPEVDIKE